MKAAVLYEFGKDMAIEEVRLADPKDREVLLRITAAGVCHSDLSTFQGKGGVQLPTILGHEATAVVERVGPGTSRVKKGDAVILSWAPNCGACFFCRAGFPTSCEVCAAAGAAGGLWDGTSRLSLPSGQRIATFACQSSFAEYAVVPEAGCTPIPASVSQPVAALVGCAVTTGFGAAVNDAKVRPGDSVAIWGLGGVGLSALMGAKLSGAETIVAVDVNPKKEAVARRFGATHFMNPKTEGDVPGAIKALTKGRGADATFDCIGKSAVFEQTFDSVRAGGTIVVVGQAAKGEAFRIPSGRNLMAAQKRIIGSHYGGGVPEQDFLRILGLYANGKLDLDALIGKTVPLEGINDAFRELESGIDTRTVITFA